VTYTSWRRDRLLSVAERNGTFSLPFIEKVQQASSDDRILHGLRQYAPHSLHQQLLSFAAVAINHRGVDLISDALPFGRLWYGAADAIANAIGYAKFAWRL
jgi:hypothetical protein